MRRLPALIFAAATALATAAPVSARLIGRSPRVLLFPDIGRVSGQPVTGPFRLPAFGTTVLWVEPGAPISTLGAGHAATQGIRIVDAVNVTVAREEVAHGLNGEEMTVGETEGRKWRSAAGWFSYTLRTYEDTPLTIACAFTEAATLHEAFDILVDDRRVASLVREPGTANARDFKVALPLAETAGKSQVTITLRAHLGARTARLLDVRTIQEHLEQE